MLREAGATCNLREDQGLHLCCPPGGARGACGGEQARRGRLAAWPLLPLGFAAAAKFKPSGACNLQATRPPAAKPESCPESCPLALLLSCSTLIRRSRRSNDMGACLSQTRVVSPCACCELSPLATQGPLQAPTQAPCDPPMQTAEGERPPAKPQKPPPSAPPLLQAAAAARAAEPKHQQQPQQWRPPALPPPVSTHQARAG